MDGFDWLSGKRVFEVNDLIYDSLRQKGVLYRLEQYTHRYPVCWRCGTELVFRLVDEWFISMGELRSMIADVARKVTWIPSFGLERELDWLRNMDDWMISKKRYWGLALPIFKCECGHFDVIGSETELAERAVEGMEQLEGHSPHRPWIDAVRIECGKCGQRVARIKDVGNPWLDAGIVPFSTLGYRHDRDYWREWFPGDLITESFPGQFRNWFYSLLTMSTVLEGAEPTRAIHSYALMRDEKGAEMHKSKGNAIWFEDAAERMGADAMRWVYCLHNPATNLNFGFGVADEARRRFMSHAVERLLLLRHVRQHRRVRPDRRGARCRGQARPGQVDHFGAQHAGPRHDPEPGRLRHRPGLQGCGEVRRLPVQLVRPAQQAPVLEERRGPGQASGPRHPVRMPGDPEQVAGAGHAVHDRVGPPKPRPVQRRRRERAPRGLAGGESGAHRPRVVRRDTARHAPVQPG